MSSGLNHPKSTKASNKSILMVGNHQNGGSFGKYFIQSPPESKILYNFMLLDKIKTQIMQSNNNSQSEMTPVTQCKYWMETCQKIDSVHAALYKLNKSKEKLNIELLEKDGKLLLFEEKMQELISQVKILEK